MTDDATAFGLVFTLEAGLFGIAAVMAAQIIGAGQGAPDIKRFQGDSA
jgi:hypothetical protein